MKTLKHTLMIVLLAGVIFPISAQNFSSYFIEKFQMQQAPSSQQTEGRLKLASQNTRVLHITTQPWDGLGWVNLYRNNFKYNAQNLVSEDLMQNYSTTNNTFEDDSRTLHSYNVDGNLITNLYQSFDDNNWIDEALDSMFYDSYGHNYRTVKYEKIDNAWVIENGEEQVRQYNANGDIASIVVRRYFGNQWINVERLDFIYDNGVNTHLELFAWSGSWVKIGEMTNIIWQNQHALEFIEMTLVSDHFIDNRSFYTYNAAGLMTSALFQFWDGTDWVDSDRYTINYDPQNNITLDTYEEWDDIDEKWELIGGVRMTHTYDSNNDVLESEIEDYSKWVGQWSLSHKLVYVYETFVSRKELTKNNLKIYPNPANTMVNISLNGSNESGIQVFDLKGRLIITETSSGDEIKTLDLSKLQPGLYILKIREGNNQSVQKLMVR